MYINGIIIVSHSLLEVPSLLYFILHPTPYPSSTHLSPINTMILILSLFCYILTWSLCVLPIQAWLWNRHESVQALQHAQRTGSLQTPVSWKVNESIAASSSLGWNISTSRTVSNDYNFSIYPPTVPRPTVASPQGTVVTSIVPKYKVCDLASPSARSCSTVLETITTSSCSAVVAGFFTKVTVSDCDQSITFLTKNSYSLATTSISPTVSPAVHRRQEPPYTTYVQSVASYFIAPWQSLAANDPSGITVLVCTIDLLGHETCLQIQEVWVVYTEYVPVVWTSPLSISQSFTSPVVLLFGVSQSLTIGAGDFDFSTEIQYSTMSANSTTTTSTLGTLALTAVSSQITSTMTLHPTVHVMMGVTITKTVSGVSDTGPTMTRTTTLTKTTTVYPHHS